MSGLLLVSLCKGIPILRLCIKVVIAPNERFLLVDPNNLDNLSPLISYIPFIISLDNRGLDMVVVIDTIGQVNIILEHNFPTF